MAAAFLFSLKTNQVGPYAFVTQEGNEFRAGPLGSPNVASVLAAGDYVFRTPAGSLIHCSTYAGANNIPMLAGIPNVTLVLEDGQVIEVNSGSGT
jgi:hypothetical protein